MALSPVAFSTYQKTPFKPAPGMMITGSPTYFAGQWNDKTGPTLGTVTSDSGNGTTSTVIFQIQSGNIPLVGALVTIVGTANAAGAYNVTNVAIASVSTTASGVCTITFAGTGNSANAADFGLVQIPQPEISAQMPSVLAASTPYTFQFQGPILNEGRTFTIFATFNSIDATAAFSVVLEEAIQDNDLEYQPIATLAQCTAGTLAAAGSGVVLNNTISTVIQGVAGRLYRVLVCGYGAAGAPAYTSAPANIVTTQLLVKAVA